MRKIFLTFTTLGLLVLTTGFAGAAEGPATRTVGFFGSGAFPVPGPGSYEPGIPTPESFLGFVVGERPARHGRVVGYFEALAKATPRVHVVKMGETYEGRPLLYAVISSEANMNRLADIRASLDRLADPRRLGRAEMEELIDDLPAVAWLAYSIHGDEISGTDASLAVAYRLAAGTDSLTERLRRELVVVVDPCENPDGRERYLAQMESFASAVPQADGQSLQKGGVWPWGRGNHYLFDMNRDWFAVELKETEARVAAVTAWHPQLLVDAHEMGAWDTYLFNPPRPPFNPQLTAALRRWWDLFSADQAAAFDRHGWAYYTREWNEEFYPGYGSSWPLYQGTVGILYEQAGVSGSRVSRHDGTVLTYQESVAHQYVSSIANTTTAADHRRELLEGYWAHRAEAVSSHGGGRARAFLVAPEPDVDRINDLARVLSTQGIEVFSAAEPFRAKARSYYDSAFATRTLPGGTMVIPADQPNGYLVQTILDFDPRISDSELVLERRELLKHRDSRLYEVTGWSLLQGYGVEAYEAADPVTVRLEPWRPLESAGGVDASAPDQGFVFSTESERGRRAVAALFDRGVTMYAAKKPLDVDGRTFARGSIFVPRRANPPGYAHTLDSVGKALGLPITGINSGKGVIGPDLGGEELGVLRRPRTAIVADEPTSFTSAGAVWHLFDWKLGLPVSLVPAARLSWLDLSIYNVIILPDAWGSYAQVLGPGAAENLAGWVEGGGTLIALGGGADYCVDSTAHLSAVRLQEDVLEKLTEYREAARREIAAERPDLSGLQIWSYRRDRSDSAGAPEPTSVSLDRLKEEDELARVFAPHGVIMRTDLDRDSWLCFGLGDRVPVMLYGSRTLLAQFPPVQTVARFAEPASVRLSGLLWPEARARVAHSAFCTREGKGRGQIILFADDPSFRGYFRGSARLLVNAVLFGPGLGAEWTPDW